MPLWSASGEQGFRGWGSVEYALYSTDHGERRMGDIESWIAGYAAIVATGALFLEVRRWFESGPRLRISATPNMITAGRADSPKHLWIAVANAGDQTTTLEAIYLAPLRFPAWRIKPKGGEFYYLKRSPTLSIPAVLEAGHQWTGLIEHDPDIDRLLTEDCLYVLVYSSNSKRPRWIKVRPPAPPIPLDKIGEK